MNPRHCSVLVLGGSQDEISLLSEAYGDVVSASSSSDALLHLENTRTCAWKLFLIDVENMDRNINQESRLKECLKLLQKVREKIEDQTILSTVPIVCSTYDRPDFMLDCLLHGAADYILKPLRVQCIKTLFLNVYRYRHQNFKAMKRVQIRSYTDPGQRTSLPEGHVWQDFRDKLKGVFLTETWLQDTVFNYLAPKPSVEPSILQELTSSDRIKYLKSRLCSWDFVPMEMDETELVECVCMIFEQILSHPDLETFRVPKDDLHQFVLDIFNSYHNTNPYHNFRHAVDVLQSTYYFLCKMGIVTPMDPGIHAAVSSTRGGICNGRRPSSSRDDVVESRMKDLLRPIHILALMMACVGHDIGHPGVTNVFMINSGTPLAVLYNDRSVLESYHSMAFFHLLSKSCFKQLTDVKHASFRKLIINSILATDMGMHDEYVQQVIDQSNRLHRHDIDFGDEITRNHERFLLCGAIIKCADISNCARPFPVAKKWAEILAEEFARQGDLERELELDVLPINQRGKVCLDEFQLTFKRKVAVKLFVAIGKVLPEMQFCLDFIRENIKQWEEEKARRETSAATSVVKGQSCTSVTTKQAIQPVNCQQSYIDDEDENNNDSGNNDHEDGLTSCPFALSPNAVEPLHSNPKSIHESSRNNRSAGCQCCIQ